MESTVLEKAIVSAEPTKLKGEVKIQTLKYDLNCRGYWWGIVYWFWQSHCQRRVSRYFSLFSRWATGCFSHAYAR